MNIELSPQNLEYVREQVALGNFASEQAALDAAIGALRERQRRADDLRAMLQPAIDQLDSGEGVPFDVEDIKRRGRERLAQEQQHHAG